MLTCEDLCAGYGRVDVLHGVSLSVRPDELVALIGPNGAGKTTALRTIVGLLRPTRGRVAFDGTPLAGSDPADIVARGIALVPQGRMIFHTLTVRENLRLGAYRAPAGEIGGRMQTVLAAFPALADRLGQQGGTLSGGQQQMLVIGRALMAAPRIMAIDEPSLGLAPKIIDQVYEILARLRAQRKLTLLIVEQSSTRAMMTGGRMILIRGGRIVLQGEATDMVRDERLKQAYFGFGDH